MGVGDGLGVAGGAWAESLSAAITRNPTVGAKRTLDSCIGGSPMVMCRIPMDQLRAKCAFLWTSVLVQSDHSQSLGYQVIRQAKAIMTVGTRLIGDTLGRGRRHYCRGCAGKGCFAHLVGNGVLVHWAPPGSVFAEPTFPETTLCGAYVTDVLRP